MTADFKAGDIIVSRLNGPFEAYAIGRLEWNEDGNGLRFRYVDHDVNLEEALAKAVKLRAPDVSVWPLLGKS